jgi:hypothetical protein
MKIARYWTRAEHSEGDTRITARGWSDTSIDAARQKAREIAQRVAARINAGLEKGEYLYGDRPLPEPVIREFPRAVVTRNSYGALVLNTDRLMFVDIDKKARKASSSSSFFSSLFGKQTAPAVDPAIEAMSAVVARHNLSARLYETAAGYRLMVTNRPIESASAESQSLLAEFQSDPLYIRLCKLQESFRARLTPKPWRCGFYKPFVSYPYEDEAAFEAWRKKYDTKSADFATCRFIDTLGGNSVDPEFAELTAYHDRETKSASTLPLA